MRIGIVNDLKLAVEVLRRLIEKGEGCEGCQVAWVAETGQEAVDHCRRDRPDLVLMDLIMPEMDGVEATRRIMETAPCPILVVTATVDGNYAKVFDALGAGALDAVDTPTLSADGALTGGDGIRRKIRTIRRLHGEAPLPPLPQAPARGTPAAGDAYDAGSWIAIAASTGGPEAMIHVLAGLPAEERGPITVVQHLGAEFLEGYVSWLADHTEREVLAATSGARPEEGQVLVAAGDEHLLLGADGRLRFDPEPVDLAYRPSADVFFSSLLPHPRPGVGVVLTGMGRDGARGLLALRQAGWATLAQDEATSVVYGMPRAAVEEGAAGHVVPIDAMGMQIHLARRRLGAGAAENGASAR